ncbi:MAG TPA: Nramp family divalent metal transporter [Candidatus Sulfotelmatobacter sp.]|nr:Nramp family divalent metal transporter [Candidatus Sulfotelmatobacter sp.]
MADARTRARTRQATRGPKVDPQRPADPTIQEIERTSNPLQRALKVLGPGLVTGASDDDPSGIGTYAQAGAQYGFATLWATLAMFPLMSAVQYICAKIGLVNGRGLAGVLREHYPRWVLYPAVGAVLVANTVNAGADLGAIAAAINLLAPIPILVLVAPVSAAILALQLFGSYRLIERVFKWLCLALLAYVAAALFARPDLGAVLRGTFIPTIRLDAGFIGILVALLGTTISPYLFFWQASQEVEEQVSIGRKRLWQRQGATKKELRFALWDTLAGMGLSEIVAYFIIVATGATLFTSGHTTIGSATDAAQALRPVAGDAATLLLAVALIGAGMLAVPVLTGAAAYALAETFRWRAGLDEKPSQAREFYGVIVAATVIGMLIDFAGINPIDALVLTAVLNGLLAPPLLVLVMLASNDRDIMGARTNGRTLNALGWLTTAVMSVAAIALLVTTILG